MKGLNNQNLRDHMTDLELIFSMLGEASTTAIVKTNNPIGFIENKVAAKQGGKIAGDARKALEIKTGEKIVSKENYLPEAKKKNKKKKKDLLIKTFFKSKGLGWELIDCFMPGRTNTKAQVIFCILRK